MYHHITVVGNVGKDPEMKYTPAGQAVTSFSVAANNQYKNKDGETVKETVWFRIEAWGTQAENCSKYVKKGMLILVEGRFRHDPATGGPRIWVAEDGSHRASYEVKASNTRFLSRIEHEQEEKVVENGDLTF